MKAIETRYQGCRFRSRLEARWAVFMDHAGIRWEYEKEGFDLDDAGPYLPDFWLPSHECWLEVKPAEPNDAEQRKLLALMQFTKRDVYCVYGSPGEEYALWWWDRLAPVTWKKGICCTAQTGFEVAFCGWEPEVSNAEHLAINAKVANAMRAARSARFEFGESGGVR